MDDIESRERRAAQIEIEEPRSALSQIRLGLGVAGLALLILFLVQNLQHVDVNFLWFEWHVRLIYSLIATAFLGALTSMLLSFIRRRSQAAAARARAEEQLAKERAKKR